jgi:hypothetical protein
MYNYVPLYNCLDLTRVTTICQWLSGVTDEADGQGNKNKQPKVVRYLSGKKTGLGVFIIRRKLQKH